MTATTCDQTSIVRELGSSEAARAFMREHTDLEVAERFSAGPTTVYAWERVLDVATLRKCRSCGGVFHRSDMWLNARGQVQDGLCKKPACKDRIWELRGINISRSARESSRVSGISEADSKWITQAMGPATEGRLRWLVHGEACTS